MNEGFEYVDGVLCADGVEVASIAESVGTPFYCYSASVIVQRLCAVQGAFSGLDHSPLIAFAVKSNPNLAVLQVLGRLGAGADVVSIGEFRRARKAGIPANRIVFSGIGKTIFEMTEALEEGIFQFNIESEAEAITLSSIAISQGRTATAAIRVNPLVDALTHPKIATGGVEGKFGIPIDRAAAAYRLANSLPGLVLKGVAIHIGSQLTDLTPLTQALARIGSLIEALRRDGIKVDRVDVGGGLGISYAAHVARPPSIAEYGRTIIEATRNWNVELILEPGRSIVADAGILVASVIRTKNGARSKFLVIDAAMNDLLRPSLYDAWHEIEPVRQSTGHIEKITVVGPICESADTFATNRKLAPLNDGDLVAFRCAGAYGATMASTYNARPLIPEVMTDLGRFIVVRRRQTLDEMWATERMLDPEPT